MINMFETLTKESIIYSLVNILLLTKKRQMMKTFCPLEKYFIDMMIGINSFVDNLLAKSIGKKLFQGKIKKINN